MMLTGLLWGAGVFAGLIVLIGLLETFYVHRPPTTPLPHRSETIPFCACSRGSQRLGMHW